MLLFDIFYLFYVILSVDFVFPMFFQLFADLRCSPSCPHVGIHGTVTICPPDCFKYKGTWDVLYKIIRQVGDYELIYIYIFDN